MAVLARARAADIQHAAREVLPAWTRLRGPELGLVMMQGRAGGTGQAFNVGEATVARCTVRTPDGLVGHAYSLGRDLDQVEWAAALDAYLQHPDWHGRLQNEVIAPLAARQAEARAQTARRAAAPQVQFFTMATMRS